VKSVFADAVYWVALAYPKDQWHQRAVAVSQQLGAVELVTTDEVLDEFLAYFSGFGDVARIQSVRTVRSLLADPTVRVLAQSRQSFLQGLDLYEARPDKAYSLTDCISMALMRQEGIMEVLTHDVHFTQEGFHILL
jgi:predicted nucleic acid-binding protein